VADVSELSQFEVAAVRDVVAAKCGFFLGEAHQRYLGTRVAERINELGTPFQTYLEHLRDSPTGTGELQALLERLCIYETRFMRDPPDFRALSCCVLPLLVREMRRSGRQRLRVVSAGCSTGQEAYSLAMILHEAAPELRELAFEVVGLDISGDALDRARRGRYSAREVAALDQWRRERYLVPAGGEFEIAPWLRERCRFLQANLATDCPITQVEIIFCRNVLIYFNNVQRQEVIRSLLAMLRLGGFLIVGSADSTWEHRDVLQTIRVSGSIVFRRFKAMKMGGAGIPVPQKSPLDVIATSDRQGEAR
jgi:chemotaxis methyl-accepting protein methylase